jgi:hypothetical protein
MYNNHEHEVTKRLITTDYVETTRLTMDAMTVLTSGLGFLIVEDIHIFHEHKLNTVNTQD